MREVEMEGDNPTLVKRMHSGEGNEFDLVCSRLSCRVAFWLFFLERVVAVLTRGGRVGHQHA